MSNESSTTTTEMLDALRVSHDRLVAVLAEVTDEQAAGPSYDDDWCIGQVASHLGSGAEVFALFVDAGLRAEPTPGVEAFSPIWEVWDAKAPGDQVRDVVGVDASFLGRIERLTDDERDRWRMDLFGEERSLAEVLRMRLGEHVLHTWDIEVAADPSVALPEDAAGLIVDNLSAVAERAGQASDQVVSVEVRTTGPDRAYRLDVGPDGVQVAPVSGGTPSGTSLTLPAEAFIRLVYGRLDPDHTPAEVTATGVDLDLLRRTFPGV